MDISDARKNLVGDRTILGLCRLLTGCENLEEAIELASKGDNSPVDVLTCDICQGDYESLVIPGLELARRRFFWVSSVCKRGHEWKLAKDKFEYFFTLRVVNVWNRLPGHVVEAETLGVFKTKLDKNIHQLLFVGNVLQQNNISKKLLASAMKRWLNGHLNVLLLEHERFFSAVGVLLEQLNHTGPNSPAPQTLQRAMNTMRQRLTGARVPDRSFLSPSLLEAVRF